MLSNNCYDVVAVMHQLSKVSHFLKQHGIAEAQKVNQPLLMQEFRDLNSDLDKHIEKLRMAVEGLSREGKFR